MRPQGAGNEWQGRACVCARACLPVSVCWDKRTAQASSNRAFPSKSFMKLLDLEQDYLTFKAFLKLFPRNPIPSDKVN